MLQEAKFLTQRIRNLIEKKLAKKDYDGDGKLETPDQEWKGSRDKAIKKAVGKKVDEKKKPSAGLSKSKKSAVVKKAKAGGDIGKKGKGFEKVEKAAKAGGARDPEAVAAAAMWKNIPREESVELDEKKLAKKDYDGDGKLESPEQEWKGSRDKAIKATKKKEK